MASNHQSPHLPETGFIRLNQILQFIPVGKSTWFEGMKSGRFPQGIKIGPKTTVWRCEVIRQLIDDLSNGVEY